MLDLIADNHGAQLNPQRGGQLLADPQQFPGNLGRLTFRLLDEDPHAAIEGQLFSQGRGFFVDLFLDGQR